jgi:hypothetical protein
MKTLLPRILAAALALAACDRAEARTEAPPQADASAASAKAAASTPLVAKAGGGMSTVPRTTVARATAVDDTCAGQDAKPAGQVAEAGVEYGKLCAYPTDSTATAAHADPTRLVAQLNAKAHGQP